MHRGPDTVERGGTDVELHRRPGPTPQHTDTHTQHYRRDLFITLNLFSVIQPRTFWIFAILLGLVILWLVVLLLSSSVAFHHWCYQGFRMKLAHQMNKKTLLFRFYNPAKLPRPLLFSTIFRNLLIMPTKWKSRLLILNRAHCPVILDSWLTFFE